jgi:hypothetical protein
MNCATMKGSADDEAKLFAEPRSIIFSGHLLMMSLSDRDNVVLHSNFYDTAKFSRVRKLQVTC